MSYHTSQQQLQINIDCYRMFKLLKDMSNCFVSIKLVLKMHSIDTYEETLLTQRQKIFKLSLYKIIIIDRAQKIKKLGAYGSVINF